MSTRFLIDPHAPKQCAVARKETEAVNEAKYTGHAGSGGLQRHSLGALYPYIVYGQETPSGLKWGVMNGATDFDTGPIYYACAAAYEDAEYRKGRDNV